MKRAPHPALIVVSVFALALAISYGLRPNAGFFGALGGSVPAASVGWLAAAVTYRTHPWSSWVLGAVGVLAVFGLEIMGTH